MTVEFISAVNTRPTSEIKPTPGFGLDVPYFKRYARTLEDAGFDYTLVPYFSGGHDPFTISATIAAVTERLRPIVALRPNTLYPTVAAKALATLDQLSEGRATVHFIAGGDDKEQAREGDFLTKSQRYARQDEYIRILRQVWQNTEPFSHEGTYYRFEDFVSAVRPIQDSIPISLGGSSADAYRSGGALADIFGLWGEPLADTQEQIDAIGAGAEAVGRVDRPRIWVTFRPIIAPTEALAWEKAHATLSALEANQAGLAGGAYRPRSAEPANVGSQRLLSIAQRQDLHDRALWTPTATATNAGGASTALVGTPETVAAAILDYIDLGAELISIRGYDNLNDAIDYGRYILPLVKQELAHREATGQRGTLQVEHPGAFTQEQLSAISERKAS